MFIQGNILSRPRGKEGIWWMRGGVLGQVSQKKTLRWYYARMWFIKGMLREETGEGVWAAERGQAKLWFHAQSQPDPWGSSGMLSDTLGLALTWGKKAEFSDPRPRWSLVLRHFQLSRSEGRADPTAGGRPLQKVADDSSEEHTEAGWGIAEMVKGIQGLWVGHDGWSSGIVPTTDGDSLQTEVLAPR